MEKTAMMLLIDMLDQHISKHKDYANKFDTGAMVAKNFAMSLLDKEKEQIINSYWDGFIKPYSQEMITEAEQYYNETFKSE
jgi:hypothetical protein